MKLIYAIVFFLILFQAQGQIHRGIKELTPYYTELDKLNEQLRSDPRHFSEGYQQLIQVSENKKDSALLSFLYILKGSYHFYLNKRDSAIYYFENASSIAHRNGNFRIENTANIRRVFAMNMKFQLLNFQEEWKRIFIIHSASMIPST